MSQAAPLGILTGGFDEQKLNSRASTEWQVAAIGDYNGDHFADTLWRNDAGAVSIWNGSASGWQENAYFDASVGSGWSISAHQYPL